MNVAPHDFRKVHHFGPFTIDDTDRLLVRSGKVIPLTPKAADTLVFLLRNAGHICEKEELIKAVWPNTFVEDTSLAQNISQIRRALGETPTCRFIETISRRGYRFIAEVETPPSKSVSVPPAKLTPTRKSLTAVALGIGLAAAIFVSRSISGPDFRVLPLTTYPGGEYEPALSSDGTRLAFVWNRDQSENYDIYTQPVSGGTPVRLTNDPAGHGSPAWSPDGSEIAFLRYNTHDNRMGHSGFYVMPAGGGAERMIASSFPLPHIFERHLDWSPDGHLLALVDKRAAEEPFSIFVVSVQTGGRTALTNPPRQSTGDTGPAFSPDGRNIAFKRTTSSVVNDLYVIAAEGGEPRRLTFDNSYILGHAWSADSREIIVCSNRSGAAGLWRVPASGGPPHQISSLPISANFLTVARKGRRLAFSEWSADNNIWKYAIDRDETGPTKLIASTRDDRSPQISPDGSQIVFRSNRSGSDEIWASDSSGSNALKLTDFRGPLAGTPRWSPDGRHIVFDARPGGNADIYVIGTNGSAPRRITTDKAEDVVPSWSRDGKWIYFASNRNGSWQVWKIASDAGEGQSSAVQVTHHGGFAAFDRPGDSSLYYAKGRDVPGLWKITPKGDEEPVLEQLKSGNWGYWAATAQGIYFLAPSGATIDLLSPNTGKIRHVAKLAKEPPFGDSGLSVAADGRWLLCTQTDHSGSEIKLVENFR